MLDWQHMDKLILPSKTFNTDYWQTFIIGQPLMHCSVLLSMSQYCCPVVACLTSAREMPELNLTADSLFLSGQPLQHTALGTGCANHKSFSRSFTFSSRTAFTDYRPNRFFLSYSVFCFWFFLMFLFFGTVH